MIPNDPVEASGTYYHLRDELLTERFRELDRFQRVEAALLGTLFFCDEKLSTVVLEGGCEEWFTTPLHRTIWNAMVSLAHKRVRFDPVVLDAELCALRSVNGPSLIEIAYLFEHGGQLAFLKSYSRCLRYRHADRDAKGVLTPMNSEVGVETYAENLTSKSRELVELYERLRNEGNSSPSEQLKAAQAEVEDAQENGLGLETGLPNLDTIFRGWRKSQYILCGARPSVGKSAFAVTVVEHLLRKNEEAVPFIASVEMRVPDVLKRLISCRARVPIAAMEDKRATDQERARWSEAIDQLDLHPCYVEHKGMGDVEKIRASALNLKMKHGRLDLVVVDHIHHMRRPPKASPNEALTHISKSLLALCHELECPMLVLAQLNRGIEKRDNPEPQLSDLRDSGTLEEDAVTAFFLHRPDLTQELTTVYVRKNRGNNPGGVAQLTFKGAISRFFMVEPTRAEVWSPGKP